MFTLVPRRLTRGSVDLFVGGFELPEPPPELRLSLRRDGVLWRALTVGPWQVLEGGPAPPIYTASLPLELPLEGPGSHASYEADLHGPEGTLLARSAFDGLPAALPRSPHGRGPHRPLTVWVSSCFHEPNADLRLEETIRALLEDPGLRPHLTLLMGDQVYADFPQWRSLLTLTRGSLLARFNRAYARTWTNPGFARLLAGGGTWCVASDHEFWNNFPGHAVGIPLRSDRFWGMWHQLALERFTAIQAGARTVKLDIGDGGDGGRQVSFFLADTCLDRTRDGLRFLSKAAMDELEGWLAGLDCPGVLLLGQPVIAGRGDPNLDSRLPDFRQYWRRLLPALRRSPQDLVVLAGDQHWGRIAETALDPEAGTRLVEIVSSPLALISESAGGPALNRPRLLAAAAGIEPTPVSFPATVPTYRFGDQLRTEEHGMTLSFHAPAPGEVGLTVRAWMVRHPAAPLAWQWTTVFQAKRRGAARGGPRPAAPPGALAAPR